jgi:PPOX class probable F420-dependent enzyme
VSKLDQFENQACLNLETYRKTGEAMRTPVWFVRDGDVLMVRTVDSSGKVKRARNNASVRVMPCGMQGEPLGEWQAGTASVNDAEAYTRMKDLLIAKYGPEVQRFEDMTHANGGKYTVIQIKVA